MYIYGQTNEARVYEGIREGLRKKIRNFLGIFPKCRTPPLERVVGTSKFQITKPDALFVVFLGTKWAYDFLKKNRS